MARQDKPGDSWPWLAALAKLRLGAEVPIPFGAGGDGVFPFESIGQSEELGRATYKAARIGEHLFITASGTLANFNEVPLLRQSPLRIYPPQFEFLVREPQISLPALRPFKITEFFHFPSEPATVVVRDADGQHAVQIVDLSSGAQALAPESRRALQTMAFGRTLEEAIELAVARARSNEQDMADALFTFEVTKFGKIVGGIAGLDLFFASVGTQK